MGRKVREVSNMKIDEISLVDRPANQFAKVLLSKRAPKEEVMPEYFTEDGEAVDLDNLEFGDIAYDESGQAFIYTPDGYEYDVDSDTFLPVSEELQTVGKSLSEQIREDLSKALTDVERNEAISKALEEVAKADQRAKAAEEIAKSERDMRLTREYIAKAAEYNVPIEPAALGPVLFRMAETMSHADCAVIHKALSSAGELIFQEIGYQGGGDNADILSQVDAQLNEQLSKSDAKVTKEQAFVELMKNDNSLYDQYLADRANR